MFRPIEEIEDARLTHLLDWWRAAASDEGPPDRAAFEPLDFPRALPHLFLLDADPTAEGGFRYRLAGTHLEQMLGQPLTGRDLFDVPFGDAVTSIWAQFERTRLTGRPTYCEHAFVAGHGRFVHYRRLLLPLTRQGPEVKILLGVVVFEEAFDV